MINQQSGKDKLWRWFGLSYASFLTLPRAMMHEMPDEWQSKMADLLEEYDEHYANQHKVDLSVSVSFKRHGKYVKPPKWVCNYRHPDKEKTNELKGDL